VCGWTLRDHSTGLPALPPTRHGTKISSTRVPPMVFDAECILLHRNGLLSSDPRRTAMAQATLFGTPITTTIHPSLTSHPSEDGPSHLPSSMLEMFRCAALELIRTMLPLGINRISKSTSDALLLNHEP